MGSALTTAETLEDHLRRATLNFTARLPEDQVLALGVDLLRELARAHAESPARHPSIEPSEIPMVEGKPRLEGGTASGSGDTDLFEVGALLHALAGGARAEVSWRLDGPPPVEASTIVRRAALASLCSRRAQPRYPSAEEAAAALLAAATPRGSEAAPWPVFRGGADRTGARPASGAAAHLSPAWDSPLGNVVASPVLTASLAVVATSDGRLLLADRATGRTLHDARLANAIESSPALSGRILSVGTDEGEVVGFDLLDGREAYRVKVGQLVRSSPLSAGDRLLVGVVDGKSLGAMVALDAVKGTPLWRRKLGPVFSSPALAGNRVLVGSDDGSLHALDVETGAIVWSHPIGAKVRATPAVSGEVAIVGDFGGRLVAVRVDDGTRLWTRELGFTLYSSACISGQRVVVGSHEGQVHGLDLATGEVVFSARTRGPVIGSAAALGDRFLIGSTDGDLYLLDAAGLVLQRTTLSASGIQSSPAVDSGLIVVGSGTGLHALTVQP